MGGNIPGGNVPGGNFPGGSLMGENFPRENFPRTLFYRTPSDDRFWIKNITTQISHHSTFHFLRCAHFSYMKCLFTGMQNQVAYFLREIQNLWTNISIILRDLECDIFRLLFLYEHKHIGRFSNMH